MSVANYSTILTENNNSNIRVLANQISFQNWGSTKISSNASLATNLSSASNFTVMTILGSNVGIRTATPTATLDIVGNINLTGVITRAGAQLAATSWQTTGTTTWLTAGSNLGIGTNNAQGNDIYTTGTISANNVFARNAFFIGSDNQATRNALQLSPLKANFIVSQSNQSVFTVVQSGVYTGTASNADVYLNGLKLAYKDALNKDYDLSYQWTVASNTQYTLTLTQPAVYDDILDVAIWPSFYNTTSCNLPGYVYQQFGSYQWLNQGANNVYMLGNVGIGTISPLASRLHIHNTSTTDANGNIKIAQHSGGGYATLYLRTDNDLLSPGVLPRFKTGIVGIGTGYFGITDLGFAINNTADNSAMNPFTDVRMIIKNDGNVGIGITTPVAKLHVNGTAYFGNQSWISYTDNRNYLRNTTCMADTGTFGVMIGSTGVPQNKLDVLGSVAIGSYAGANAAPTYGMIVSSNVGIGTTNPIYPLDVVGQARFANATGTGVYLATVGATAWSSTSDMRVKKDITEIPMSLDIVNRVRPVKYRWISDDDSAPFKFGFIAQELEQVIPELVSTTSSDTKAIATTDMIPFLAKAVQELSQENANLKDRITVLENFITKS